MAKNVKKVAKASTTKKTKATKAKIEPKKTGTIRDKFGLREGSHRAKLVDALLAAKGKPVHVRDLLRIVYGKANDEWKTALNMVLIGMKGMIATNKLKMEVIRDKDDKGPTIALKTK